MAYTVAQLRKDTITGQYMENLESVSRTNFPEKNPFIRDLLGTGTQNNFQDFALQQLNTGFLKDQVYYIRFKVRCIPESFYSEKKDDNYDSDVLRLVLLLKLNKDGANQEAQDGSLLYQQIGTCTVPTATKGIDQAQYATFSMIFTPIQNYDTLVFKVQRTAYDVITHARNWSILDLCKTIIPPAIDGNPIVLSANQQIVAKQNYPIIVCQGVQQTDGDIARLNNIVPMSDSNGSTWYKFGYQGRPGDLLVINRQPIRVGRSGIYEFNNGLVVNSFMIAQPNGNVNAFLLDYAYESNS